MGAMPRVLLTGFCAVPGPRRAGVQLRHVIRALTPMHSVDLLVMREGDQAYVERQGSIRILRVPTPEAALDAQIQSFQRALKRQLEGADYDVVHCRDAWSGHTVLEARDRLGYSVVYDLTRAPLGEAPLDPELDAQVRARRGRVRAKCRRRARADAGRGQGARRAAAGPERVVLSPPGVDVDRFDWDDPPSARPAADPLHGVDRSGPRRPRADPRDGRDRARGRRAARARRPRGLAEVRRGAARGHPRARADRQGRAARRRSITTRSRRCSRPRRCASCRPPPDPTPNPTVVFPTKLLEYMACRRAIVAPKRETVTQVVEHGREALLFEPGDPIDLARKVLRLLGEPALRDRLAANAYDRVRREHTASAARRAIRNGYDLFGELAASPADEDAPKVELLADDDFEATVFEEAPVVPAARRRARPHRRSARARGGAGRARRPHRPSRRRRSRRRARTATTRSIAFRSAPPRPANRPIRRTCGRLGARRRRPRPRTTTGSSPTSPRPCARSTGPTTTAGPRAARRRHAGRRQSPRRRRRRCRSRDGQRVCRRRD